MEDKATTAGITAWTVVTTTMVVVVAGRRSPGLCHSPVMNELNKSCLVLETVASTLTNMTTSLWRLAVTTLLLTLKTLRTAIWERSSAIILLLASMPNQHLFRNFPFLSFLPREILWPVLKQALERLLL